jgi:hypothetical protein
MRIPCHVHTPNTPRPGPRSTPIPTLTLTHTHKYTPLPTRPPLTHPAPPYPHPHPHPYPNPHTPTPHLQRACTSLLYEAALLCDDGTRLQRAVPFLVTQVADPSTVVRCVHGRAGVAK